MKIQVNYPAGFRSSVEKLALKIENIHQQEVTTNETVTFQQIEGTPLAVEQFILALLDFNINFGVNRYYSESTLED